MSEHRTEADAIIDELRQLDRLATLHESGIFYDTHAGEIIDIRGQLADRLSKPNNPARKTGTYLATDIDSFNEYVAKHMRSETELWGTRNSSKVTAVLDAHGTTVAGWEDHKAELRLEVDPDWNDFMRANGSLMGQDTFAEFIEDHLHVFAKPKAADMLELAQTFQATTRVDFESSSRVKSGETQLVYQEHSTATAGKKGTLAIPDEFVVGLSVYRGTEPYAVSARFRYRMEGQHLRLGYKLVRPDKVLDDAFDQVTTRIASGLDLPVWRN